MQIIIHEKILQEARLPLNKIRGSANQRKSMAGRLFCNFYKEINKNNLENGCSVEKMRETLDKILHPEKINYIILKEQNPKFNGSHGTSVKLKPGDNGELVINHTGYKFLLPIDETGDKIINKFTAYHEARHFFDHLCNPKYSLLRCGNGINHEQSKDDYEKLREMFLTDLDNPIKIDTLKLKADQILKKIPNNVSIDGLQSIRYSLLTEINSYKEEIKCYLKDFRFKDALIIKLFLIQNCKFKAKLKYVNAKLKELIFIERQALSKQSHN